ncbi:MAG: transposase [Fimbriimonadaceae bacterium]
MRTWPHAPSKCVTAPGLYFVTAATYHREKVFADDPRIEMLHDVLLETAEKLGWEMMAWAVFANHYHFVGVSPNRDRAAAQLCSRVHTVTANRLNALDGARGRRVWYRSWDLRLTFEKSVMARLAYVVRNPVHHGLVTRPEDYPWCSARWFIENGDRPFVQSVMSFKTDKVKVYDDF